MTVMDLTPETLGGQPMRKKRRPALSCQECRRRKIRCDRRTPCGQCSNAKVSSCSYVCDSRTTPTTAPFEAHDTRFSVLQQGNGFNHDLPVSSMGMEVAPQTPSMTSIHSPGAGSRDHSTSLSGEAPRSLQSRFLGWSEPALAGTPDVNLDFCIDLGLGLERPSTSSLQSASRSPIKGVFFKSRFLGQSHWKNFAGPVSSQRLLDKKNAG